MNTADRFIRSCSSWDDFCLRIGKLSNGEKGRTFERLVQLYLQTQPKYADLSKVWLLAEVQQKVRQKLNLPERDEGIDLIARDRRGRYWAIQAKWRTDMQLALSLQELGRSEPPHSIRAAISVSR
jgi:predicted helicase